MMAREIGVAVAAAAAVAVAWQLTAGRGGKLAGQLKTASGGAPAARWGTMRTPATPAPYGAPCPPAAVPGAIVGPHPIKTHPRACSPVISAAMANRYDWMFSPPSEDDL